MPPEDDDPIPLTPIPSSGITGQPSKNPDLRAMETFLARELEIMAEMPRYYDWIADRIRDHVKGRVIEIGAGIGALTERLLPFTDHLELVEPSRYFASVLRQRFAGRASVSIHNQSVESYLNESGGEPCDAAVMVNVLEHIEDDAAVLAGVRALLGNNGRLLIFVPALPILFSNLDEAVGHHRRYTQKGLAALVASAGFEVIDIRYMDLLGILPWWIVMTLLGNTTFNPRHVRLYDAIGIPLTRGIESVIKPRVGKNLLVIAGRR